MANSSVSQDALCNYNVTLQDPIHCNRIAAPAPPSPPPAPPPPRPSPPPQARAAPPSPPRPPHSVNGVYVFNSTELNWFNESETFRWTATLPDGPITQCLVSPPSAAPVVCVTVAHTLSRLGALFSSADGDSAFCVSGKPRAASLTTACGSAFAATAAEPTQCQYTIALTSPWFC